MTCPTCTPAKRCDACERVAIVRHWEEHHDGRDRTDEECAALLSALDAHDRARLAAPEMVERVAMAMYNDAGAKGLAGSWLGPNGWADEYTGVKDWWRSRAAVALAAITEAK